MFLVLNMYKNKKVHYYYPDIFIPKDNLIIEVKSIYTYNSKYFKSISYEQKWIQYEFWIYDKNKNKIII